jgi:hypothetical protein
LSSIYPVQCSSSHAVQLNRFLYVDFPISWLATTATLLLREDKLNNTRNGLDSTSDTCEGFALSMEKSGTAGIGTTPSGALLSGSVRAISSPKAIGAGVINAGFKGVGGFKVSIIFGNSGGDKAGGMGGGVFGACNGSVPSRSRPGTPAIIDVTLPAASMEFSLGGDPTS